MRRAEGQNAQLPAARRAEAVVEQKHVGADQRLVFAGGFPLVLEFDQEALGDQLAVEVPEDHARGHSLGTVAIGQRAPAVGAGLGIEGGYLAARHDQVAAGQRPGAIGGRHPRHDDQRVADLHRGRIEGQRHPARHCLLQMEPHHVAPERLRRVDRRHGARPQLRAKPVQIDDVLRALSLPRPRKS